MVLCAARRQSDTRATTIDPMDGTTAPTSRGHRVRHTEAWNGSRSGYGTYILDGIIEGKTSMARLSL